MAISVRNVTIKGIFAEDANTTIPAVPVSGISYRDTNTTAAEMEDGFPFKSIVDSSKFNEMLFEYSSISKLIEIYGFVPWSSLTDYEIGSCCLGTNGMIYQAVQASGPSSTAINPVNDSGTYWDKILINISEIIPYLNQKVNLNGDNATFPILKDFQYDAQTGDFYVVWSNDLCIQGGLSGTSGGGFTQTLLVEMSDTNYNALATCAGNGVNNNNYSSSIGAKTTQDFVVTYNNFASLGVTKGSWLVIGKAKGEE